MSEFTKVNAQNCSEKEIFWLASELNNCTDPEKLLTLLSLLQNVAIFKIENCQKLVTAKVILPLVTIANGHSNQAVRTQALLVLAALSYAGADKGSVSDLTLQMLIQVAKKFSMSPQILDSLSYLISAGSGGGKGGSNSPLSLSPASIAEMLNMLGSFLVENEKKCGGKKNEELGKVSLGIINFVIDIVEEHGGDSDGNGNSSSPPKKSSLFPLLENFIKSVEEVKTFSPNRKVWAAASGFLDYVQQLYPQMPKETVLPLRLVRDTNSGGRSSLSPEGKTITFTTGGCAFLDVPVTQGIMYCEAKCNQNYEFAVCDSTSLAKHFPSSLLGYEDCCGYNGSIYYGSPSVTPASPYKLGNGPNVAFGIEVDMTQKEIHFFHNGKTLPYTVKVKPASLHFGFYVGNSEKWDILSLKKLTKSLKDPSVNCQVLTWT